MHFQSCSLRDFEVLQEIDAVLPSLLDKSVSSKSFFEMLPASIRTISLRCSAKPFLSISAASTHLERIREVIRNLLEAKNKQLPLLTDINVRTPSRAAGRIFADAVKAFDTQGVALSL